MSEPSRGIRQALVLGLALLAIGVADGRELQTGATAASIDIERLGPKVGTHLPAFTLRDQRGEARSLQSLLGPKGAFIVFFRSADW